MLPPFVAKSKWQFNDSLSLASFGFILKDYYTLMQTDNFNMRRWKKNRCVWHLIEAAKNISLQPFSVVVFVENC